MNIRTTTKTSAPVFATLVLILFGTTSGTAAPGDLDTTFGNGGIVITNNFSYDADISIQPDGKIIVLSVSEFGVARYNSNGSLDTSFGNGGKVYTSVGSGPDFSFSVAIQADGKIVVAGQGNDGSNRFFALVRYNTNGTLDNSFNGTGIVTTPVGNSGGAAFSVAIQADGKIVAFGGSSGGFTTVRYKSDGSLDTSFGGTGIVVTSIGSSNYARSMAIQADGKIIAAGRNGNRDFAVVRYNADGTLDNSFGGSGIIITPVYDSYGGTTALAIQSDGKIIAAGSGSNGSTAADFVFVRYNPNGSLDTSFGGSGKVIISFGNYLDYAFSVAIQKDSKIVAVGASENGLSQDMAVVRLNPNGSLDTTFNGTGKLITDLGGDELASAIAIQSDGKIVVGGVSDYLLPDFHKIVMIRYQGGSNANIRTRFDFDGDGKADGSVFRPSDRTWYVNRSTQGFSATQWGLATDKITPADYDGDGKTDISVYRDGTWYRLNSSNQSVGIVQFGVASDIPVPADYTGDGKSELAVYRNGAWWIQNLTNNQTQVINFGLVTDKPVAADYDGDGRADQAVYRNGEWHLNRSSQGYTVVNFGLATDKPVIGDYDGDGRTDQAVYRDGTWHILQSSNGYTAFPFGISTDIPAPADYDGDGKTDAAVYRNGVWYLLQSTNGISFQQFGLTNDKPVPAAYVP